MKSDPSCDSRDSKHNGTDAYGSDPNAPASSVYVGSLGQVGIGTVTPVGKLDVEGGGLTVNGGLTKLQNGLEVVGGSTVDKLFVANSLTINDTNSGSFSALSAPNKIPVADQSGHIDAGWLYGSYVSIGAQQQGTYVTAIDTGSINQIVLKPSNAYSPYVFGTQIEFLAKNTNTGATTVTINSAATVNLVIQTPVGTLSALGGEIVAGNIYRIFFDGAQWQLLNPSKQPALLCGVTKSADQNILPNTATIIQFDSPQSDSFKWFNSVNYSIKPNISGWFELICTIIYQGEDNASYYEIYYLKNSTTSLRLDAIGYNNPDNYYAVLHGNQIIYFNGTTDYLQLTFRLTNSFNVYLKGSLSTFNLIYRGN